MAVKLAVVIKCAKFPDRISHFPIDLSMFLQHCSASSKPMILCQEVLLFRSRRLCGVSPFFTIMKSEQF